MRLEVKGVGSVTLPYAWSEEGATEALPRIQEICKRFADGAVSLKAVAQSTEKSDSQMCPAYAAMSKSRKGDYLEQYVITKLMAKGIEVFKNVSCVGKTDLVARRPGEEVYYPFDVKSKRLTPPRYKNSSTFWNFSGGGKRKNIDTVYLIIVSPEISGYVIEWRTDKDRKISCPPGWETMFDGE